MFIVHVWYDGHNQKVGGIEEHDKENLFSRLCGPLRDKVVMVHIVERILKLVMTYQVESQTRTTGKTACWPPSSFPWAALLLLLLLPTGLLLLLQPVPEGLAWSAGAACELRSRADPSLKPDRPSWDQPTDDPYLSIRPASTLRASLPATPIALPKMFFMTQ